MKAERLAFAAAVVVILIAFVNCIGWLIGDADLVYWMDRTRPMHFNTALCFILLGAGAAQLFCKNGRHAALAAILCGYISGITALQYVIGHDLGIDNLFVDHSALPQAPTRMTFNSSLALLTSAVGLFLITAHGSLAGSAAAAVCISISLITGALSLLGYGMGVESVYGWQFLSRMSVLTALCHVLVAAALLVPSNARVQRFPRLNRHWPVILTACGGLIISLAMFSGARSAEESLVESGLMVDADFRTHDLQNLLDREVALIRNIALLIENSGSAELSEERFNKLASRLLEEGSPLVSIDWAPRVTLAQRPSWERRYQSAIFPKLPDESDEPSFPSHFSTIEAPRRDIQGFNHYSDPARRVAMLASLKTLVPQSTGPVDMPAFIGAPQRHFLVYAPVYARDHPEASVELADVSGFVVGVFNLAEAGDRLFKEGSLAEVSVELTSDSGKGGETLYRKCAASLQTCDTRSRYSRLIKFAGQLWRLHFAPSPDFGADHLSRFPLSVLLTFLLITVISSAYILGMKRHALRLSQSEERFRLLIDGLQGYAIYALDLDGMVTTWNDGAKQMTGYSAEEIIGKNFEIFYSPEDRAEGKPQRSLELAARHGRSDDAGWRIRKDGSRFFAEAVVTPMKDDTGAFRGYSKVTRDITEQRKAEQLVREKNELLLAAKEQAESSSRLKSQFVANVSHEIRTPLTSVIGFTEELIHSDPEKEIRDEQLGIILRNARHLLRLINKILDISKIEAGKLEVDTFDVDLWELIEDISHSMTPRAAQKRLDLLIARLFPLPKTIRTDPTRFKQIIFNVVDNAIKFTREGSITIAISCNFEREQLIIKVSDTGIGMTADQVEKIFTLFGQADASIGREFGGTGLGLNIARELAHLLGGDLTLESTSETGSVFSVAIGTGPLAGVEKVVAMPEALKLSEKLPATLQQFQGNVLLAEDMPDTQRLLSLILKQHGLTITTANNGQEAIDLVRRTSFDLVFIDMQMPIVDGPTATRMLRLGGFYGPIIALTANVAPGRVQECISAGCDGCLGKPFERNALTRILSLYLVENRGGNSDDHAQAFKDAARDFKRVFGQRLIQIERAIDRSDFEYVENYAHALAGAAAFAWPEAGSILVDLEDAAGAEDGPLCRSILTRLKGMESQVRITPLEDENRYQSSNSGAGGD